MQGMRLAVLVLAVALFGCGGAGRFVGRGMDAYKYGDYANAIEHFNYIEREGLKLNERGEVRYLVYRGLTLAHLGKKDEAKAYLLKGKAAYAAGDPNWLPTEIVSEMDQMLAELGVK
ncbi:Hypothetical protein A7982_02415 [Minicystis rosea]|nr:Hypothetical protein A7982_02415 [Minicystis rosea]